MADQMNDSFILELKKLLITKLHSNLNRKHEVTDLMTCSWIFLLYFLKNVNNEEVAAEL